MYPVKTLNESLTYRLSLTAGLQERRLEAALRPLGLTRTALHVLLAVGAENLHKPSEIASRLHIGRAAASRALRQMEAAGLVARQAGRVDRRTTCVVLTEEGRRCMARGLDLVGENDRGLEARLTAAESLQIRQVLAKLTEGESCPEKA
jgi:DNA-binding MarR family transcriptional regulator